MKERHKGNKRNVIVPAFADVATLIDPQHHFLWLPAFLEFFSQGVRHDIYCDESRPSKAATAAELNWMGEELDSIKARMARSEVRLLLRNDADPEGLRRFEGTIVEIKARVDWARSENFLMRNGKLKRGRGKARIPGVYSAKTMCAGRVLELIRFFWKSEPGIGSLKAGNIAQAFWLASGGISNGYGDPAKGWKRYFREVRENSADPNLRLLLWRRELIQTERRGRPSEYAGSFFRIRAPEFKSAFL
jgi:hypothetical protein